MKLKFFLSCLFLFLLSSVSLVSASADVDHIIMPITFTPSTTSYIIDTEDYFSGWDILNVTFDDITTNNTYSIQTTFGSAFIKSFGVPGRFTVFMQNFNKATSQIEVRSFTGEDYSEYPLRIIIINSSDYTEIEQWVGVSNNGVVYDPSIHNPVYWSTFPYPYDLGYNGTLKFRIGEYFRNYDEIQVSWVDPGNSQTKVIDVTETDGSVCEYGTGYSPKICIFTPSDYGVLTHAVPDDFIFTATAGTTSNTKGQVDITFVAKNFLGTAYGNLRLIYTNNSAYLAPVGGIPISVTQNPSIVGYVAGLFTLIYPSEHDLSLSMKFAYVFITFLFVDIIILVLMFKTQNMRLAGWIIIVLNVLMVFYFLAIRYIPISILILFVLIAILIAFFKVKAGG